MRSTAVDSEEDAALYSVQHSGWRRFRGALSVGIAERANRPLVRRWMCNPDSDAPERGLAFTNLAVAKSLWGWA